MLFVILLTDVYIDFSKCILLHLLWHSFICVLFLNIIRSLLPRFMLGLFATVYFYLLLFIFDSCLFQFLFEFVLFDLEIFLSRI